MTTINTFQLLLRKIETSKVKRRKKVIYIILPLSLFINNKNKIHMN